ncbi:hypothetical protein [Bradyrhizobium sp. Tv2a-2]|uniref:hypothetical protein n=1 Tax=Bradyrhizobium sp. Tv2a-2 TaxID=113395 RepID=UPI00041E4EB8|nr:hypothetical protein [Bradyrhizobium sp. Tv2a-2]
MAFDIPADVLSLGGFVFTDYSPPSEMPAGGRQAMVIHKLPGGARVIDTLGPDDADIQWNGFFYGSDAYQNALQLDAMRADGQVLALTWGGQYRSVIISDFKYSIRRMPVWVIYSISCTVVQNPMQGDLSQSTSSVDDLVSSDLSSALAATSDQGTAIGGAGGSGL